jgi:hypothetical protein
MAQHECAVGARRARLQGVEHVLVLGVAQGQRGLAGGALAGDEVQADQAGADRHERYGAVGVLAVVFGVSAVSGSDFASAGAGGAGVAGVAVLAGVAADEAGSGRAGGFDGDEQATTRNVTISARM